MDMSRISLDDLKREVERRENSESIKEELKRIHESIGGPVGIWKVQTEGDCEGRSMVTIGNFEGHIVDVMREVQNCGTYRLYFTKIDPPQITKVMPSEDSFDVKSRCHLDIPLKISDRGQPLSDHIYREWLNPNDESGKYWCKNGSAGFEK